MGTLLEEGHVAAASEVRQEEARCVTTESEVRQHVRQEETRQLADMLAEHFADMDVQHLQ